MRKINFHKVFYWIWPNGFLFFGNGFLNKISNYGLNPIRIYCFGYDRPAVEFKVFNVTHGTIVFEPIMGMSSEALLIDLLKAH